MRLFLIILFFSSFSFSQTISDMQKPYFQNRNLLNNPGFESGIKPKWTASGGTSVAETNTADVISSKITYSWDPDAASQTLESEAIPSNNAGTAERNGEASCLFRAGTSNIHTYKMQVRSSESGGTTLAEADIPYSRSTQRFPLNFIWPAESATASVSIRILAVDSNEPKLFIDDCYLGAATNLNNVSQANFIGSAFFANTTNCNWTRNNTALGAFGTDADCPAPTVEFNNGPGVIQSIDADLPQITINNLPPGNYRISFNGYMDNTSGVNCVGINDGTTASGRTCGVADAPFNVEAVYKYTTSGNRTFALHGSSESGTISLPNDTGNNSLRFYIYRFPTSSEIAVNSLQGDYGWTDFPSNAAGTLIKAVTTNPTFGTVTVNRAQHRRVGDTLEIRWDFVQNGSAGTAGSGDYLFDISQLGLEIDTNKVIANTASSTVASMTSSSIGSFSFRDSTNFGRGYVSVYNSTQLKAFALFTPGNSNGAWTAGGVGRFSLNPLSMSLTASVPIVGWKSNQRAPTLIGSVTSGSNGAVLIESAQLNCDGTSTVLSQMGSWVSTISNISGGACVITFSAGAFGGTPYCHATINAAAQTSSPELTIESVSVSSVKVDCSTTSADCSSWDGFLTCTGPK